MSCLICLARTRFSDALQYFGFIFDPAKEAAHNDDEGFMPRNPRFRIDGLSLVAFCTINSILYVFETDNDTNKSVYSLDLSVTLGESSSEMVVIEKGMLEKCTDMESPKVGAEAIVTPKGKILIFSHVIDDDNGGGFELFDPDTKRCRLLPQLPNGETYWTRGFGFLSDALFMISTTECGKFVFDFDRNDWQIYKDSYAPWGEFISLGNKLYSVDGLVTKRDSCVGFDLDPPLSSFPDSVVERKYYGQVIDVSSSMCLVDGIAEK
ncbi:hypothetical protein C2S52_013535 [Perilla frutescens var. hirtella]|nr:hypothetical protein C2S51_015828 [Perilla frutescens var. frutescens]KAH6775974.1 hypothetical protein C2S52_013535 [Perilla frutescens var. hirtella]